MLMINNATEFSDPQDVELVRAICWGKIPSKIFIKENNLVVMNCSGVIHFVELDNHINYSFWHWGNGDIIGIVNALFKIKDIDLALYMIIHTYHRAIYSGYDGLTAVLQHPQYSQYVNIDKFDLQINEWRGAPLFSPFVKEVAQNLNTRITPKKLVKAILAGQVEKVICNGNHTDNWGVDQDNNYWIGEWDVLDLAEKIFRSPSMYFVLRKDINTLSVLSSGGEYSESYTVYLKDDI